MGTSPDVKTYDSDRIAQIAMQVIINAGDAKACIEQAMASLAEFDFEAVDRSLAEADDKLLIAHKAQTETIQAQAAGEDVEYSLLFVHAQDTLMTISEELHTVKSLVPTVRVLNERLEALEV